MIKALVGYIISLLVIITMFAIVLQDFNEQMEINRIMIEMLDGELDKIQSIDQQIEVEPHKHNNQDLVDQYQYKKDLYNLNWQLSAIEERVIEIQRRLSP
ncbi:hypothetical protein OAP09_02490 [Acidimicrobiia bacterium]|nr:hypothetical protein [Acidimicrobiia bacterium]